MRVLHVTTTGKVGGAERLIADLAGARLPGLRLSVCTLDEPGELGQILTAMGIPCYSLDLRHARGSLRRLARLAGIIRSESVDVVHGHLLHGAVAATLGARLAGGRVSAITRHYAMAVHWYGSRGDHIFERTGNALASRIFAISNAVRRVLVDDGVDPSRIEVIPNGIDAERVQRAGGAADASIRRGRPVLGTVGSLHPRKGHADLLRAVARLREQGEDVDLVLIGGGSEASHLQELTASLGISDRVRFLGHVADPYPAMAAFDVYVQPSVEEGFGISVLEAMALALPVVATTAGGLPEIVEDGLTGILVAPGDPAALTEAIGRALGDTSWRLDSGTRARNSVVERFGVNAVATAYAAAYARLLDAR